MIIPMKKVSLVVMEKEREASLLKLRGLGVIHLERKNAASEGLSKLLERKAKIENVLGILRSYGTGKKDKASGASKERPLNAGKFADSDVTPDALIEQTLNFADEKKGLQDRLTGFGREWSRIEEWGNFDPKDIPFIAEKSGLNLYLYKFTRKNFENLPRNTAYILLGEDKNSMRIMTREELSGETPFVLPEQSLSELDSQMRAIGERLADIEKRLAILGKSKGLAERELKKLQVDIEFETARAGMDVLTDVPDESAVSWITGFIPQEDLGILKRSASENGWALAADDPGPDDMVPTKLKHNRLVKLLNPLTDFLEVTPGYNEADISGWFLLFFTIFFGMIFGDAAYGAIFIIAAIIGIVKTMKKGVPPILKLLLLLGSSNFIWGMLTCTWFGVAVQHVPEALQNISLPLISNVTSAKSAADEGIVRQNLMIICFTLALFHLSVGHIIAIMRCKTLKILGDVGSIAMLVGMYGIVLALIASNEYREIPLLMPFVYLLGIGFVVNFAFVNYDGSVGKSVLESFKNIISMILGIANVFSDIMSYIRLWAVGLAGAAISSTIDTMAGPMLGHFIFFIFGVVLLVFGHGLNLVLNVLSVLVHGVRLNTLEFSSHVGLTWAGTPYKPFKETEVFASQGATSVNAKTAK